jgi:SAM-dependent methyltransferase
MREAQPWKLLARFYEGWVNVRTPRMNRQARRKLLGKILPGVRSVCDLGCGTGRTALELARSGVRVFAVDLSPTMCRITRERARRAGLPIRVFRADMRRLRLPEPVDLVTCEFNVLNYLPRHSDLERVARAVARALRPGGHFYFDVNTPRSLEQLAGFKRWNERKDFLAAWRGSYSAGRRRGEITVRWFVRDGKVWRRFEEQLNLVCWTPAEIRSALRRAGFTRIRACLAARVRPAKTPLEDTYYVARSGKV